MIQDGEPKRMTNKEYLIAVLTDDPKVYDFTDYESEVYYRINCPYFLGDERARCKDVSSPTRKMCEECKCEWLEKEIDE